MAAAIYDSAGLDILGAAAGQLSTGLPAQGDQQSGLLGAWPQATDEVLPSGDTPASATQATQEAHVSGEVLSDKVKFVRQIVKGCAVTEAELKRWKGSRESKPGLPELRNECLRRVPSCKPAAWLIPKCSNFACCSCFP